MAKKRDIQGDASKGEIELRYDELGLDEVVANNVTVHLERMSDNSYYLGIYTKREEGRFYIGAARAKVIASCTDLERVQRKAAK